MNRFVKCLYCIVIMPVLWVLIISIFGLTLTLPIVALVKPEIVKIKKEEDKDG